MFYALSICVCVRALFPDAACVYVVALNTKKTHACVWICVWALRCLVAGRGGVVGADAMTAAPRDLCSRQQFVVLVKLYTAHVHTRR